MILREDRLARNHPIITKDYIRCETVSDDEIQPRAVVTVEGGDRERH